MKYLTSKQMTKVDKIAVKKYNLTIPQMMENAGRNLAQFTSSLKPKPKKVIVFFGKGNNGRGGLVAARHLAIKGINIEIIAASLDNNQNIKNQLKILRKMKITPKKNFKAKKPDIIIDALLGYNIKGNPRLRYSNLINAINFTKSKGIRIISLDIPSGLDPNTGKPHIPTVNPNYTLTLALPKIGLKKAKLKNVYLTNIGIPNQLYKDLGIKVQNYFSGEDIIKIS